MERKAFDTFIVDKSPKNLNYKYLSITDQSRYSSLMPWHYDQVSNIFLKETKGMDINHIVDANAHIGVDSIMFRNIYPDADITAIELDKDTFGQLEKNIQKLSLITNKKKVKTIEALNMDCLDYIFKNDNSISNNDVTDEEILPASIEDLIIQDFGEDDDIYEQRKDITLIIHSTKSYKPLFSIMLGRCVMNKQLLGVTYDAEIENLIGEYI